MPFFTREHQIDMILIYGETMKNKREAAALYAQRFPERDHPSKNYFPWLENYLKRERNQQQNDTFIVNEAAEINTLACVEIDKTTSLRQISISIGISYESVRKILNKYGYKSFKYQIHHHLFEGDHQRRLEFCNWFLNTSQQQQNLEKSILFSDESRFTNLGMFNRHNVRYWATENQHLFREGAFQVRFGVNVWMGVIDNHIIGPIFFNEPLNAELYLNFLNEQIEQFLDNLPLNDLVQLYYQQDGAPPHNARAITDYLGEKFGDRWIGTNGPVRWPARSPDLTPLDFSYWAYIKERVYHTQPLNIQDLTDRITTAIQSITPVQMQNVLREFKERIHLCREVNGGSFEHLLYG